MASPETVKISHLLQTKIGLEGSDLLLSFMGSIDELTDFDPILDEIMKQNSKIRTVLFDVSKINSLNSVGIRNWILFLQRVEALHPVEFSLIGETFAELASMIQNVLGMTHAEVRAILVPYECVPCNARIEKKLKLSDIQRLDGQLRAPVLKCDTCGKEIRFDGIENEFFSFIV